ncbi:Aquaporin [Nymphaea thermarum]|nr:Aquaporin [Nymphaea thermarum]
MAGVLYYDEEAIHSSSNRIQPFASTPRINVQGEKQGEQEKFSNLTTSQLICKRLGLRDLFNPQVWRASVGELVGTAVLVFALGTITISSYGSGVKEPNILLALLVFLAVTVILLAVSPISGGHINPAITLSAALIGLISPGHAAVYMAVQCAGGILGALALKAVVSEPVQALFSLGGCTISVIVPGRDGTPIRLGVETETAFWLELFCTFILLFASIWMAFDIKQARALGRQQVCAAIGLVVGLMAFVSSTVTGHKGYSGAGMNPARCLGPAVVRGGHLWEDHWVFWVAPMAASCAFYLYTKLVPADHFHGSHEFKYDGLKTVKLVTLSALGGKGN